MTLKEVVKNATTSIVDVRSEMEYNSGYYCRSGNRSGQAVSYLRQMGIGKIYNGGGLEDVQYYLN